MSGVYLEPIALLDGVIAQDAISAEMALPLAGGPLAFCAVRLWERTNGDVKHAIVRTTTIRAIDDQRVKDLLDRLCAPRLPVAGLSLSTPRIMGILNVTPDSFSDGGDYPTGDAAVAHGMTLVGKGADIIDIGGESTRPGADSVDPDEELRRVLPVVHELLARGVRLSIDTRKPEIMERAAQAGVAILNDVSALSFSEDSLATAARLRLPTIIMHAQGDPKTMQDNPTYENVVLDVYDYLESRIELAAAAGLPRALIIADPGFGFGKNRTHNLALFQSISIFHGLGVPLLAGASRKRFIREITGAATPKETVAGNIAAALAASAQGVQIVRVHDVLATRQALSLWHAVRGESGSPQNPPN